MSIWNDNAATLINRIKDVLVYSDYGNNITNLALDMANRAQAWISMYRPWDFLKKVVTLTIGADRICSLPTDLNTILRIYVNNGDGGQYVDYYPDAPAVEERYELFDDFTASAGHVWYIQLPSAASIVGPLSLKYTYDLPNITAEDQFLFYPSELLLRAAHKLHIADKGLTGDRVDNALAEFERVMANFIRNSQHMNQKMDLNIHNKYGTPVKIGGHALDGSGSIRYHSPYQNSSILVR
jgi:hypothetical protein